MATARSALAAAAILLAAGCSRPPSPLEIGERAFSTGDTAAAIRIWKEAAAAKPDEEIYVRLVTAAVAVNDLPQAERWADEGLTHFPRCANLLFNRALAAFHGREYAVALDYLLRTEKEGPYTANLHLLRGLIYEALGRPEEARKEFIAEVNINPGCRKAWEKLKESAHEKG